MLRLLFMGTWLEVVSRQISTSLTTKDERINNCTIFPMYLGSVLYGYENNKNKALYTFYTSGLYKCSAIDYSLYGQSTYFRIYSSPDDKYNEAFRYAYSDENINIKAPNNSVKTINTATIKKGKYKYVTQGKNFYFVLPFSCVINNKSYKYIHAYSDGTFAFINDENIPVYPSLDFRNNSSQLFIKVNDIIEYDDIFNIGLPEPFVNWFNSHFQRIYENVYTIKSITGSTLTTLTEAPPMISSTLTTVGNAKYLTLKGENNTNYTMEWTSETPQGKIFAGLATSKGGSIVIPVGETSTINLTENTDLFEVWQTYRPPTTTFEIKTYNYSGETSRVDKTDYLTPISTLSGVLRGEASLLNFNVLIQSDTVPNFNYCYIDKFKRYYYVTEPVSVRQNLWEMTMQVDALMTYKDSLLKCEGYIDRNEYIQNKMIIDNNRAIMQGADFEEDTITNELFGSGSFVLSGLRIGTKEK